MSTSDFNTNNLNWKVYCSNIQTNSGQNLTLDASGNSSVVFKTNGTNRLTINQAGLITFGTLGSYDPSTNFFTATKFVGDLSGNTINIAGGLGGSIPYQSAVNTTALLANGTAGQVLTSNGTTLAPSWTTPSAGSTISITDTSNNAVYYPTFVSASGSGQTLRADISTSPLSYNPSTNLMTLNSITSNALTPLNLTGTGGLNLQLSTSDNIPLNITGTSTQKNISVANTTPSAVNLLTISADNGGNQSILRLQTNASANPSVGLYTSRPSGGDTTGVQFQPNNGTIYNAYSTGESIAELGGQYTTSANMYYNPDTGVTNSTSVFRITDGQFTWGFTTQTGSSIVNPLGGITSYMYLSTNTLVLGSAGYDIGLNIQNVGTFTTSAVNLTPPVSFTQQLTLPTTRPTATFTSPTLSCDFGSKSTGIFTATLTANMTAIAFTNGRIGGQYVIYVSASGGTRTIASTLSGTSNKTNYTTAISVAPGGIPTSPGALLTITFDGARYMIAGSAYN